MKIYLSLLTGDFHLQALNSIQAHLSLIILFYSFAFLKLIYLCMTKTLIHNFINPQFP